MTPAKRQKYYPTPTLLELGNAEPYISSANDVGCSAAVSAAALSDHGIYNVGSCLKRGGKILSIGANRGKTTSYYSRKFNNTIATEKLHAEISSIIRCLRLNDGNIRRTKMYVARVKADGSLANSRPCSVCFAVLREAGIKRVVYTTDNGWFSEKI